MKQKILMTYAESGFGHISSMDSIYDAISSKYSDRYDIQKSYILHDDNFPHLTRMEKFITNQVKNTNRLPWFGDFVFSLIHFLGGHKLLRFFHRQMAHKSFHEGLAALKRREPDVIVTNHYFTQLLAVEYKRRINPDVVVINYNPDHTLHSFWDHRDGIFIVNNERALKKALHFGFKKENIRSVLPCVRKCVEICNLSREELREKHGLPQDKFTVVIADGGYMLGRGPKFARKIIKSGLPISVIVVAGTNKERYEEFKAISEGRGKIKVKDGMFVKAYEFVDEVYELYGAADLFITKGGPNAVLDSVYMRTPVMVNYHPHLIEKATVRTFIKNLHCGERVSKAGEAVKRIKTLMNDPTDLAVYRENIDKLIESGNGATSVADIIDEEASKKLAELNERGDHGDGADTAEREQAASETAEK